MKISASLTALFLIFAVGASPQEKPKRKKLLAIGRSEGYQHDSISHGLATIWKIGQQSGLWDTFIRTDTQLLTKKKLTSNAKNLDYFDAVMFYSSEKNWERKAGRKSAAEEDGGAKARKVMGFTEFGRGHGR